MARRPAATTRPARAGRPAEPVGGRDPQERLAALLARGYGGGPATGGWPPVERARSVDEEEDSWDEEHEPGEDDGGEEELEGAQPTRARGGRGGRRERRGAGGRHRAAAAPPLWSLPSSLRDARRSVSWRAVAAVAVLVALAGAVLAVRVGSAQASAQPQTAAAPPPLTRTGTPSAFATPASVPSPSRGSAASGPAATASAVPVLVVDVAGQVARPGLVRLPAGSRVADALARAGGAGAAADLRVLNLARPLVDGERLYVPRPGEVPPTVLGPVVGGGAGGGGGTGAAGGVPASRSGAPAGAGGPVDLNAADLAALDGLPGVGPVLAQRILDWRTQHGRFTTVDELGEVSGIGDKLLGTLRPLVRV